MGIKIRGTSVLAGTAGILACTVLLTGCGKESPELGDVIAKTAAYQQKTVERPESASMGGEWTVISLARSQEDVPDSYWEIYRTNLEKRLKDNNGVLSEDKYTEYARAVLALAAIGEDPADVGGYNLLEPLTDLEAVTNQGVNGAAFALLALDSGSYDLTDMEHADIRDDLVNWLLDAQLPEGGFAMNDGETEAADPDITAMAVQALAPYRAEEEVEQAIQAGIAALAELQGENGTWSMWGDAGCETVAQVMIALSTVGVDCNTDARFRKNEEGLYEVLLKFYDEKGGFAHLEDGAADPMATDQALCAMAAYERFLSGKNPLYQMADHR